VLGADARAAIGNARLVMDFEPGNSTTESTGRDATGAGQRVAAPLFVALSVTPPNLHGSTRLVRS
jgi:hypothetical protein